MSIVFTETQEPRLLTLVLSHTLSYLHPVIHHRVEDTRKFDKREARRTDIQAFLFHLRVQRLVEVVVFQTHCGQKIAVYSQIIVFRSHYEQKIDSLLSD